MKAELIADWRLRIADRTLITLRVTDIGRILEERDRLLAALRALSYTIVLREEDAHITGPGILGAREAIAYAESE